MKKITILMMMIAVVMLLMSACNRGIVSAGSANAAYPIVGSMNDMNNNIDFDIDKLKNIYFAGGCFWGVEEYFSRIPGVYDVTSGYANGNTENPTYEDVCFRDTGHAETVHIQYDPGIVSLRILTEQLFKIIDPLSKNRQGNDIGSQYRTGVYYTDDDDDIEAIRNVFAAEQQKYDSKIAVELLPLKHFYLAEDYHQDYLKKNPNGYCHVDFCLLDDLKKEMLADD